MRKELFIIMVSCIIGVSNAFGDTQLNITQSPSWFKKSQVSKWVIEETISQRELLDTLKFFEKNGILN